MPKLHILGGGPAGLAVGHYAHQANIPFTIYEASTTIGGNCQTIQHGDFLFDSGAHRFHDKDAEITSEIKQLMGDELRQVKAPSQIYSQQKWIDFPLTPLDLLQKLGIKTYTQIAQQLIKTKFQQFQSPQTPTNFKDFALQTYGKRIAEQFLLNYSEKLWGLPTEQLSTQIAGGRLKGLNFTTFVLEALLGKYAKTKHLDGSFYYPKYGIGSIFQKMATQFGWSHIQHNARITKVFHHQQMVQAIEINGQHIQKIANSEQLISSLPLSLLLRILSPTPPQELLRIASTLRFQHLILVAFFIKQDQITSNASIYFPGQSYPFTRIVEPKNRSPYMSPVGQTALVVEIPCDLESYWWTLDEKQLIEKMQAILVSMGLVQAHQIFDATTYRIRYAYPILEVGFEEKAKKLLHYFNQFHNLQLTGRTAEYRYTHIHDLMRNGKEMVSKLQG